MPACHAAPIPTIRNFWNSRSRRRPDLLSKDKELLKLDRRTSNTGLFSIRLPQLWSVSEVRSN